MDTPTARLGSALLLLLLFYATLFVWHPAGSGRSMGVEALEATMAASRETFEAGRYADAIGPTRRLAHELPMQHVFVERLARIYQHLGRHAEEARAWETFMTTSPAPWEACPMVADAHRGAGNTSAAVAAMERCVALDPQNVDYLLFLSQAYSQANQASKARRTLEAALELNKDYPDLYLVLGIRDFADGRPRDARRHFERFLNLAPDRKNEVAVWLSRTAGGS